MSAKPVAINRRARVDVGATREQPIEDLALSEINARCSKVPPSIGVEYNPDCPALAQPHSTG